MPLLTLEEQALHDMNFLWETSNSDYSGESKEKMKSLNQREERDEEALVNNKRKRDEGNITNAEGKTEKCRESDHEMHIWTERERRKKMKSMFSSLHALLPHLPSKADKSTIVDEAVSTIKNLEQILEKLEKQKQERVQCGSSHGCETSMFVTGQGSSNSNATMGTTSNALSFHEDQLPVVFDKTWASSNLVLNIFGDEAQFSIYAARKPGLITSIAFVLDKYKIDLITANVSCIANGNACIIQLHGKGASHDQIPDANSVEEIYKQAAGEIMLWIA